MNNTATDKPRIAAPPPVVYLAYFLATLLIDWRRPAPFLPSPVQYAVGGILIGAGIAIAIVAMREFRRAGTKFDVNKVATALVTEGIFKYSRNPGYVAITLSYLGAAVMVDSIWILVAVLPAIHWTHKKAILREEVQLEELFGDDYRAYKTAVRRWV